MEIIKPLKIKGARVINLIQVNDVLFQTARSG